MTRNVLSALLLTSAFAPCVAQVPNGGFETWNDVGDYNDPAQWVSFNSITFPLGGVLSCEQGMPGAVGASYVKVTTRDVSGIGVVPGLMYTAADAVGPEGFPYASRPEALNAQWQYNVQPGDQAIITLTLTKWNTVTQTRDDIGAAVGMATGTLSSWQDVSMPIQYSSPLVPDTGVIYILSSAATAVGGSTIWVDDLHFGAATGVNEVAKKGSFELFPSPAADVINIRSDRPLAEVTVQDMAGRIALRTGVNGADVVNVASLPAGLYIAQVRFADGVVTARPFVKN